MKRPVAAQKKKTTPKPVEDNHTPSLPPGHWLAMDRARQRVIALADTYPEIMAKVDESGEADVWVGKTPGIHPKAAARPYTLLKDESPNILDDIRKWFPDPDQFLDTPNSHLGLEKPRDVIGTEREHLVRDLLRAIRFGTPLA